MSSSKSKKKWKEKVIEDFLKRSKLTEGSIYKFQDQITLANNPNDVPLRRERVFEKTVYRISKIDKEDCKTLPKKEVKPKNLDASQDQCELIAEIDKNLKHLKDQKRFLQMARESSRTWGEHLSANQYAKEKSSNRRKSTEQCPRECGSTHVCDILQKLIDRNNVKVADSCTQIESPIWDRKCDSGDYSSGQYQSQCGYNGYGHMYDCRCDCSSAEAEWKARMNNCNFRPCPIKKVNSSTQVPASCCAKCPKSQCGKKKRVSLCSPPSPGSSPRFGTSPRECLDFFSRSIPNSKLQAKKQRAYCSDDSPDRFETTYNASYGPQVDQNCARNKREPLREKELKTKIIYTKPRNICISPKIQSPRTPRSRTPRINSVERDLKRMPYKPVKLSEEIEKHKWGCGPKSPRCKAFNQQSPCKNARTHSQVSPCSPRKVGTASQINRQRTKTTETNNVRSCSRSPRKVGTSCQINQSRVINSTQRPRCSPEPQHIRSYSKVSPRSPRKICTSRQVNQTRGFDSQKCKVSPRQGIKTPANSPSTPRKVGTPRQVSQIRGFDSARCKQSPRQKIKTPERSPSTPRKVGTRSQVSRTTGLDSVRHKQSPRQRIKTSVPKNSRSERSLFSKTMKSRQVIQLKPLYSSETRQSLTPAYEIYEKRTKVEHSSYKREGSSKQTPPQSYESLEHEREQRPYRQTTPQSYEVLEPESLQDDFEIELSSQPAVCKTQSRSFTNDLSEASSPTAPRKYNIIRPNVIDDSTYTYPCDDETEDYVILPYSPIPKEEDQTSGRPLSECDSFCRLEPTVYPSEHQEKLSESVIKKSEVVLEDASNASIIPFKYQPSQQFDMKDTFIKSQSEVGPQMNEAMAPQSHHVKEIYYKYESSHGPQMKDQYETKEVFYKSESSRDLQLKEPLPPQPGPFEVNDIVGKSESSREPLQTTASMATQYETDEVLYKSESLSPPFEVKDLPSKSESTCKAQQICASMACQDRAKEMPCKSASNRETHMNESVANFKQESSHASKSPQTHQCKVKLKSEPCGECHIKASPSPRSCKFEKKDSPLQPKPFRSEINYSTSYVKEDRPFKSDQFLKSYSKVSEDMSKRSQSSKINSNEGSIHSIPSKKEENIFLKLDSDSHLSDTSQELLSETQNPNEPLKGIDSELQNFIQYLQNRLRDCDEMVRKQLVKFDEERKECQKKEVHVCPKLEQHSTSDTDRSSPKQSDRVCQNFEPCKLKSQSTSGCESRTKPKDITFSSSAKTETDTEDDRCLNMHEDEIGELILPLDSDRVSESELEVEDECHCYRCEEYKLAPVDTEIPPFTGCDCMKEDYYKIMRVVYNK